MLCVVECDISSEYALGVNVQVYAEYAEIALSLSTENANVIPASLVRKRRNRRFGVIMENNSTSSAFVDFTGIWRL